jgi:hypothetical protein
MLDAVPIACLLVIAGGPVSEMAPITLADARRLAASFRDEPIAEQRAAGRLAERVRVGEAFVWAFPSLADAGAVALHGHGDDRMFIEGADLVIADVAEPAFVDRRFVSPGAGSMASEVPSALPPRRRAWARRAVYRQPQWLVPRVEGAAELRRVAASALAAMVDRAGAGSDRADRLDRIVLPELARGPQSGQK